MNIKIGDTASLSKTITEKEVQLFGELTDDFNPVHFDEEFARGTRFGRRIAHGMLGASLISAALANKLPGRGTVYLSQTLKFTAPVYLGDTVTVTVTVTDVKEGKPTVTLETVCTNQNGETVIKGEAIVLVQ